MKIKLLLIILVMVFMYSGCNTLPPSNKPEVNTLQDIKNAQKTVEESSKIIEKASGKIATEANKITTEASEAQSKVPENAKTKINPHLISIKKSSTAILEDTTTINKASARLDGAKSLLDSAGKKIVIVETALDIMAKERDSALAAQKRAEEARDSALHKALRWLILGSIVASAGLGVFGFMYGSKLALTLSGASIIIMSVAIFVETYFFIIIIFGGIVLLGLIGALAWNIIIQKKAFKEVVDTVEITKNNLSLEKKEELFGKDGQTGIMDSIQSPSTIDIVKKEKSKMSSLWSYAKDKKE